jgi:two-component system phosphate regulon sensor histidine kinase PhoR
MPIAVGAACACAAVGTLILLGGEKSTREAGREVIERRLRSMEADLGVEGTSEQGASGSGQERMGGDLQALATAVAERVRVSVPATRARAANLAAILDALHEPVLVTDANGRVVIGNREAGEFFGARLGGVLGRSVEDLFTQADALRLHASALGGRLGVAQVRFVTPAGTRIHEMIAAPVALAEESGAAGRETRGVVVTLRDVTDLATAVQLKTEFVANASHELRTPLSSIKGAVETLRDGAVEDAPMAARLTEMIATNVVRLEELVRDLMDLSRLESPEAPVQFERVDLAAICGGVASMFETTCRERRLTIDVRVKEGVREITSDRQLLQLVLQNLIDNATKFAYEGTTVVVECDAIASGGVRLRVSDRGIGIPINQQQRIFERFYQVDSARAGGVKRRGTGLGLAIVKHAVKRLGGTIGVQSVWKQGTTMEVELPARSPGWEG